MIYILIQLTQFKLIIFFTNNMTLYYFHFAFGFLLLKNLLFYISLLFKL